MTTTHEIKIGRRLLDVVIGSFDRHHRSIHWHLVYEREHNEKGRLIGCGFYQPTLEKIVRDDGALIEAALWDLIDKKENQK